MGIRIPWKVCYRQVPRPDPPKALMQQVSDRTGEVTFLISSQVLLWLLVVVWGLYFGDQHS